MSEVIGIPKGRYMVVGMARSGIAAAELLMRQGCEVLLSDSRPASELGGILDELKGDSYIDITGQDPIAYLDDVIAVVNSPGVPPSAAVLRAAQDRGIPIWAEIELGYRALEAPIVAIGGTNGKTTTTALTGEMFASSGKKTFVLGNIGIPLSSEADHAGPNDVVVAEIASLQLETTVDFRPRSAALLNITEDHLNRFGTMERYAQVKAMMFDNQRPEDFAVLNADDAYTQSMIPHIHARLLMFSRCHEVEEGAFVRDGQIVYRFDGREEILMPASEVKIPGAHNLENALAAICVSLPMGLPIEAAVDTLRSFAGVEHRIEFVCERDGVSYMNDSKATNPDSTIKAVEAMTAPTVLILGGSNKNSNYTPVFHAFDGKIKAVVAVGETAPQILRDAQKMGYENIVTVDGFDEAVRQAQSMAQAGDTVLLSPACASYDMFQNYEQRGRVFKQLAREEEVEPHMPAALHE